MVGENNNFSEVILRYSQSYKLSVKFHQFTLNRTL